MSYINLRRALQAEIAATPTYCQADRCLLPGVVLLTGGRRTPAHVDVGHLTPIVEDPRQNWTRADVRPEHSRCNRSAGRYVGLARQRQQAARNMNSNTYTIRNDEW